MSFKLLTFDELESTNAFLKKQHKDFSHLTCVRAKYQTQGRGQFDRIWESEKDRNLLCSILLKEPNLEISELKNQILLSLINTLKSYQIDATYKQPNDLYVGQDKICGILIETIYQSKKRVVIIIGIGLNVNQTTFETPHATSMKLLNKDTFDIEEIAEKLLSQIIEII